MTSERYARTKEIFFTAAELSVAERSGYLDRACEDDASLRAEIEQMLAFEENQPDFLSTVPCVEGLSDFQGVLDRLRGRSGNASRYEVQDEFARGGMGSIYRVWDQDLRRTLAMKVVLDRDVRLAGTPEIQGHSLGRFLEEAQVTGQLDHPGIVPVHELGVDAQGQVYFTMRLVQGIDLGEVFERVRSRDDGWAHTGWTQARAIGTLLKVCETMAYAHSRGVIHRDLKPANVMVGEFGEVYVMDWGLARVLGEVDSKDVRPRLAAGRAVVTGDAPGDAGDDERGGGSGVRSPQLTLDGEVMGTPGYMSPEQARGDQQAMGPASDVYSVGAILYQLLAGHMPYAEGATSSRTKVGRNPRHAYAILELVKQQAPVPLESLTDSAPGELVAICERAMARSPGDRYPDMSAMAADLQAYVEGRVVQAHRTGAWVEFAKWVQRNRSLAGALLAAVLLLVVGFVTAVVLRERAQENFELAERRREQSELNERVASERATDVMRLSALHDLEDLVAGADELWPPHPEQLAGMRSWIERAEELIADLPLHRAGREELRALALPWSPEERTESIASHPLRPRLDALRSEIETRRRALAQRRDGIAAALPVIDNDYGSSARALKEEADGLVFPERKRFGNEAKGLVLTRRALELTGDDDWLRGSVLGTQAWAYFALGRDEEALAANAQAAELMDGMMGLQHLLLEQAVAKVSEEGALDEHERILAELEREHAELEARMRERREWSFPSEQAGARWWNAQLTKLIEDLEALSDEDTGLLAAEAISPEHGWSVPHRLAFAERLEAGFAAGGAFAQRWEEARPAIAEAYPGLELAPQMGLVPIGRDLASGLWEFWHVATGSEPARTAGGQLVMNAESGVVLVLLRAEPEPFLMGSQAYDDQQPNYDPASMWSESAVHEVTLSPHFVSKYELTTGQWERVTGRTHGQDHDPSVLDPGGEYPVERVSWLDCRTWLPRVGLRMPSEAQWEHACRAGTDTPWWTGSDRESLESTRAANLNDQAASRSGPFRPRAGRFEDWLDDGHMVKAPVGSLAANRFGLHDVHGNVWEWCLDGNDSTSYPPAAVRDPLTPSLGSTSRLMRGGGWRSPAGGARSSIRRKAPESYTMLDLGVRPARLVTD